MLDEATADDLRTLLDRSRAEPAFRRDVLAYADGRTTALVSVPRPAPRVKVVRVLAQLLHAEPTLVLARVVVEGAAGCCDFRGAVTAFTPTDARTWRFTWDCRWRAEEAGLLDRWGTPDQSRAAREYAWRCFARWEPMLPDDPSAVEQRP
ncbi:hypothetical protein [Roseisolibacter sp. H3M3-2]|uniref:hypothetical protein n=1 Tax=Roseisolibacter sp. H3M3-2 TaxID=3031323 RepID=UPI0023DC0289|nr:hypothetical protein [Roseisolibacter sp. H3M3-2]MDF1503044.1 hypothetical protein [Roseisolibacter sp. H3M3-2]